MDRLRSGLKDKLHEFKDAWADSTFHDGLKAGARKIKHGVGHLSHSVRPITYQNKEGRRFRVKKLLSSAGRYGEIFLAEELGQDDSAVALWALKRMAVDPSNQRDVMREIEVMNKLTGHRNIVGLSTYMQTTSSKGQREVIAVMDFCAGGSLLDVLNERPGNQLLEEREILCIFLDVCEAVAHMHSQSPPIAHRDLKVENVLCHGSGNYKLCDFGSTSMQRLVPENESQRERIRDDIERNTTMFYRAPEMVDLYRKQPIDEKADVWALGCVLYKLSFACDAFDQGPLQILNAKFSFPASSPYSQSLHDLIASMFICDPFRRPNVADVTRKVASLLGTTVTVEEPGRYEVQPQLRTKPLRASAGPAPPVQSATAVSATDLFECLEWHNDAETVENPVVVKKSNAPVPAGQARRPPLRHTPHHGLGHLGSVRQETSSTDVFDQKNFPTRFDSLHPQQSSGPEPPEHVLPDENRTQHDLGHLYRFQGVAKKKPARPIASESSHSPEVDFFDSAPARKPTPTHEANLLVGHSGIATTSSSHNQETDSSEIMPAPWPTSKNHQQDGSQVQPVLPSPGSSRSRRVARTHHLRSSSAPARGLEDELMFAVLEKHTFVSTTHRSDIQKLPANDGQAAPVPSIAPLLLDFGSSSLAHSTENVVFAIPTATKEEPEVMEDIWTPSLIPSTETVPGVPEFSGSNFVPSPVPPTSEKPEVMEDIWNLGSSGVLTASPAPPLSTPDLWGFDDLDTTLPSAATDRTSSATPIVSPALRRVSGVPAPPPNTPASSVSLSADDIAPVSDVNVLSRSADLWGFADLPSGPPASPSPAFLFLESGDVPISGEPVGPPGLESINTKKTVVDDFDPLPRWNSPNPMNRNEFDHITRCVEERKDDDEFDPLPRASGMSSTAKFDLLGDSLDMLSLQ